MKINIESLFTYHPPRGDQPKRYEKIRKAGKLLAEVIVECTPECPDQTAAIRKVREAVMTANAAIAIYDQMISNDVIEMHGITGAANYKGNYGVTGIQGKMVSGGETGIQGETGNQGETGLLENKNSKVKYESVSQYCESKSRKV